jgi:hypothetical protein
LGALHGNFVLTAASHLMAATDYSRAMKLFCTVPAAWCVHGPSSAPGRWLHSLHRREGGVLPFRLACHIVWSVRPPSTAAVATSRKDHLPPTSGQADQHRPWDPERRPDPNDDMIVMVVAGNARDLEVGAVISSVRASGSAIRICRERQGVRVSGVMKVVCDGPSLVGWG